MNGSGTADSPWEITTAQEFVSITSSDTGYYKLMNNLDCSDVVFDGNFQLYQSDLNLNGKKIECFYYNKATVFTESTIHDGQIIKIIDADDTHNFAANCQFNRVSMYFRLRGTKQVACTNNSNFYQCNVRVIGGANYGWNLFSGGKISNSKFHLETTHRGGNKPLIADDVSAEYSYFTGNIVENSTNQKALASVSTSCIYEVTCDPSSVSTYGCIGNSGGKGNIYNSDKHPVGVGTNYTPVTTDQLKSYTALTSPEINFDVEEVT